MAKKTKKVGNALPKRTKTLKKRLSKALEIAARTNKMLGHAQCLYQEDAGISKYSPRWSFFLREV